MRTSRLRKHLCSGAALLALCALTLSIHAQTLMDRYSFTNGTADSVGANNGMLAADAAVTNGALVLDGNAWMALPAGTITANFTALSVEIFANLDRTTDEVSTEIAYFGNGGNSFAKIITKAALSMAFAEYDDVGNDNYTGTIIGAFAGNIHLAAVWDPVNEDMLLYENGILVASNALPPGTTLADIAGSNDATNSLGAYSNDAYQPTTGAINEFRIYNGALTVDQIRASIAAGPANIPLMAGAISPGAIANVTVSVHPNFIAGTVADPTVTANTATVANINLPQVPSVVFTSGDTGILLVTNGQVQAVGPGTATLTATYQGVIGRTSVTTLAAPAQPMLTHRYSFNTDASDSISGENGLLMGGADITNGYLDLTGNGMISQGTQGAYLSLPRDVIDGYPAVTVEIWATLSPETAGYQTCLFDVGSYYESPPWGWSSVFALSPYWGQPIAVFLLNPSIPADGNEGAAGSIFLNNVGEVQVVGVCDTATQDAMSLYANGALAYSSPVTYSLLSVSNQFAYVGGPVNWIEPFLNGTIDEIRLYYGALSATQIAADNAAGPDSVPASPTLTAVLSGQSLLVSWPAASAAFGFTLESSPALSGPSKNWQPVGGTPTPNGANVTLSVPLYGSAAFFRLVE